MSHPATERLRLQPGPDGLALVQDLLNTRDIGQKVPDLLSTSSQARTWLSAAITTDNLDSDWVAGLTERDLTTLRTLRSEVQSLARGIDTASAATVVTKIALTVQPSGEVRPAPLGTGVRWFASAVWTEIFLAQQADTWKRLKLCHNLACSSAFYDRSKNNSGVWHDVKMCGNAANLRASRARRRSAGTGSEAG